MIVTLSIFATWGDSKVPARWNPGRLHRPSRAVGPVSRVSSSNRVQVAIGVIHRWLDTRPWRFIYNLWIDDMYTDWRSSVYISASKSTIISDLTKNV